jgi:hypothetical protein
VSHGRSDGGARQAESVTLPHGLDFSGLHRLFERMATALERLADAQGAKDGRMTDEQCFDYLKALAKPLPTLRELAPLLGWSASHLINKERMPLTAGFLKHENGRFSRRKSSRMSRGGGDGSGADGED